MRMTYKERLIAGLRAMGFKEAPTRSAYDAFTSNGRDLLFVGPAGALRCGRNATNSRSIGDPQRQSKAYLMVLKRGDEAMGVPQEAA